VPNEYGQWQYSESEYHLFLYTLFFNLIRTYSVSVFSFKFETLSESQLVLFRLLFD
jgi:hypothetical protein